MKKDRSLKSGFTLLEILLVVAIIALLAGIVIIAINPGKQIGDSNNVKRLSDVRAIYNALEQYYIDNGKYPDGIPEGANNYEEICNTGDIPDNDSYPCDDLVDLSALVPTYLTAIPVDPEIDSGLSLIEKAHASIGDGAGYVTYIPSKKAIVYAPNTQNISWSSPVIQMGTSIITKTIALRRNVGIHY